jgi:hypothetical protein
MTQPSNPAKRSSTKFTMRHTVHVQQAQFSFHLPYHKGDHLYHGNKVIIQWRTDAIISPLQHFSTYLAACDLLYPPPPRALVDRTRGGTIIFLVCCTPSKHIWVQHCWAFSASWWSNHAGTHRGPRQCHLGFWQMDIRLIPCVCQGAPCHPARSHSQCCILCVRYHHMMTGPR